MSTRATYKFAYQFDPNGNSTHPDVTFYIHHDGYPEGAAQYLLAACTHANTKGGLPAMFIRANDWAEFASDHSAFGDTEYQYTVRGEQIIAKGRVGHSDRWNTVFSGPLLDFIKAHTGTKLIKHHGRYMTKETAGQHIAEIMDRAANALDRGWTGNAGSMVSDAWGLRNAYQQAFGRDEIIDNIDKCIETADRILSKGWEDHHGENAYTEWRKAFRQEPATQTAE